MPMDLPRPGEGPEVGLLEELDEDGNPKGPTCGGRPSPFRRAILRLVTYRWFDHLILLVIIANCVAMAVESPLEPLSGTPKADLLNRLEVIFNCIFTLEMVLKITAFGLVRYLRDAWNLLDITVVTTAWLPYIFTTMDNLSVLRAVRVLRALRTVNRVPQLRKIIGTLLSSIPQLADVTLIFAFFLTLFGIVGVNLFEGALHSRCTNPGDAYPIDDAAVCATDAQCEGEATCKFYELNPSNGAVSYDNLFSAFVTIFQAVTLEGWVDQMYMLSKSTSPTLAVVYYVLLVIFGALFIVNLFLAVIFDKFAEEKDRDDEAKQEALASAREKGTVHVKVLPEPARLETDMSAFERLMLSSMKPGTPVSVTVLMLIVANTFTMCMEYYGETPEEKERLEMFNRVFTCIFTLEMCLKICGLGMRYFRDSWNQFDFIVTVCSDADLVLDYFGRDADLLRALRVLRILRLLRVNRNMARFAATARACASDVFWMSSVLVLIMVVFAMLGMELFGARLGTGEDLPRTNFDDFFHSLLTVFVVTSGEDWNAIYADSLDADTTITSTLFFCLLFISGNYVLVNLFVAIICFGWDEAAEPSPSPTQLERVGLDKAKLKNSQALTLLRQRHAGLMLVLQDVVQSKKYGFTPGYGAQLMSRMGSLMKDFIFTAEKELEPSIDLLNSIAELALGFSSLIAGVERLVVTEGSKDAPPPELSLLCEYWDSDHALTRHGAVSSGSGPMPRLEQALKRYVTTLTVNKTLMEVVAPLRADERVKRRMRSDSGGGGRLAPGAAALPMRLGQQEDACTRQLKTILHSQTFDKMMLTCIIISSASLAFDMPDVVPGSPTARTLRLLDITFTSLFTVEMLLKMYAFGICLGREAYLRSGWNTLDCLIVLTSVLSLLASNVEGLGVFRSMRALRTLRPLRVVKRFPGLRKVVNSLFRAVPECINVFQVCFLALLCYGLFGMQFMSGKMATCNDSGRITREDCTGLYYPNGRENPGVPRWWGNSDIGNFDNIGYAMLTLFEMGTLEMWPDVLFLAMDTVGADRAPVRNANPWMALFIVSWIVVSAFFLLNLFVGVVLENFNAIRSQEDGSGLISEDQKEWMRTHTSILKTRAQPALKPPAGRSRFARLRRYVFTTVTRPNFEYFVGTMVLLNVASMGVMWYTQPHIIDEFEKVVDVLFTTIFTLEMCVKIFGLGPRQYLRSGWNVFDAILVTGALSADTLAVLSAAGVAINPAFLRLLRIFRVARLLRLMRLKPGISRLITTVYASIPALGNVGLLLGILMYIYAVLGVELFHDVVWGEFINEDANFTTFGMALLTLFRCITGESYNGLMHDAMVSEKYSAPGRCSDKRGDCGTWAAVPYFITFTVLGATVMLNLIVAVVLDAFAEESRQPRLTKNQIDEFAETWAHFDQEASNFIPSRKLRELLEELPEPMGFKVADGTKPNPAHVTTRMKLMAVPDRNEKMEFHEVLEAVGKIVYEGVDVELPPSLAGTEVEKTLSSLYQDVFKQTGLHKISASNFSAEHLWAVAKMQRQFRHYRYRQLKRKKEAAKKEAEKKAGGGKGGDHRQSHGGGHDGPRQSSSGGAGGQIAPSGPTPAEIRFAERKAKAAAEAEEAKAKAGGGSKKAAGGAARPATRPGSSRPPSKRG